MGTIGPGREQQHHAPDLAQDEGAVDVGGQEDFFQGDGLGAMLPD